MLTYEDCLELCNLTEEEILEISGHEHIPMINALELGDYLIKTEDGELRIKRMIIDDIDHAKQRQDNQRLAKLELVLKHFISHHHSPSYA